MKPSEFIESILHVDISPSEIEASSISIDKKVGEEQHHVYDESWTGTKNLMPEIVAAGAFKELDERFIDKIEISNLQIETVFGLKLDVLQKLIHKAVERGELVSQLPPTKVGGLAVRFMEAKP